MDKNKNDSRKMVWIRIDDRTHIEVPATMTEEEKRERVDNYHKNSKFKPIKGLL